MRIISYNVNGFRAFHSKGALERLVDTYHPDVLCLQEVKIGKSEFDSCIDATKYDHAYNPSQLGGYAGVATLINKGSIPVSKLSSVNIMEEYGSGRIVEYETDDFILINVYTLNSGSKDDLRKDWNYRFFEYINKNKPLIICGDLNVVSAPYDYWGNWRAAIDSMPGLKKYEIYDFHERNKKYNLVDSFRKLHSDDRRYSWYSYRGGARAKNHGWRLDYFLVSESLMPRVKDSVVLQEFEGSDHTPIMLDIE